MSPTCSDFRPEKNTFHSITQKRQNTNSFSTLRVEVIGFDMFAFPYWFASLLNTSEGMGGEVDYPRLSAASFGLAYRVKLEDVLSLHTFATLTGLGQDVIMCGIQSFSSLSLAIQLTSWLARVRRDVPCPSSLYVLCQYHLSSIGLINELLNWKIISTFCRWCAILRGIGPNDRKLEIYVRYFLYLFTDEGNYYIDTHPPSLTPTHPSLFHAPWPNGLPEGNDGGAELPFSHVTKCSSRLYGLSDGVLFSATN